MLTNQWIALGVLVVALSIGGVWLGQSNDLAPNKTSGGSLTPAPSLSAVTPVETPSILAEQPLTAEPVAPASYYYPPGEPYMPDISPSAPSAFPPYVPSSPTPSIGFGGPGVGKGGVGVLNMPR